MSPSSHHTNPPSGTNKTHAARDQLLERIRADKSLPTLGVAIAKVIEITSSGEDSVTELAHFILSDVSLSQQILRLSNTIAYRTAGGVAVTTISRAIFLLGFDTIKASALATLLVDGFRDKRQAHAVRKELIQALCASVAAREIAHHSHHPHSEEAAVAALFKNIGRILVASFDHTLYEAIHGPAQGNLAAEKDLCNRLLGCSFERFGEFVLHDWKIPETIIHALHSVNGEQKKSQHRTDWIKQVASFSEALASILVNNDIKDRTQSMHERCAPLMRQFGAALDLNRNLLDQILQRVEAETRQLAIRLDVRLAALTTTSAEEIVTESDFCNEFMLPSFDTLHLQASGHHPSGKPINARDLLLAGVQDATQMLSSNQVKLNELILLVLETMYAAMGFRFATACLRDLQNAKYVSRISVGEKYIERQRAFQFPVVGDSIFHLAMNNNADLMIADALNRKIQTLLPYWHKALLPDTRSFIILPLVVDQKPIGFFYADRVHSAEEGVPPDETALIKTLKGQLLAAIAKRS